MTQPDPDRGTVTLGAVFLPSLPPERLKTVVAEADRAGLQELWVWEDCFKESGVATAAAALGMSERLRVGIGLLPVALRNVAVTAMELATLERMFPGRVIPGVGHGVLEWMGQVGARAESPMTLLREQTAALVRLLDGERVTTSGRYVSLDRVQLDWPPDPRPPVLVGAIGPKTQALAGEVGDGVILTAGTSLAQVASTRALIDEAARSAGRAARPRLVVFLIGATGPDAADRVARDLVEWDLGGDPADCAVAGDAATVAAIVQRMADAGADSVVLQPTQDEPDTEGFIRFVAQDVAGALTQP